MRYKNLVFIALIVVFVASCGAKRNKKEPKNFNVDEVIDVDNDTANYPVDLGTPSDDLAVSNDEDVKSDTFVQQPVVDEKPVVEETPKVEETPQVDNSQGRQKRYYIVVGSFRKYGNAKRLNSYFRSKGYKTMVLPKTNELNRVAIASYVNLNVARRSVKSLREKHNNYTFWVYRW